MRKAARDAVVSWQGSRYSVPWAYAGKEVWVRERDGQVEVRCGAFQIAQHALAARRHLIIRNPEHHEGIPMGSRQQRKTLVHLRQTAPVVETKNEPSYGGFLLEVLSAEADARRQRYLKIRLQLAHLPYLKNFDRFDFTFHPSIADRQIRELRTCASSRGKQIILLLGPRASAKTHLALAEAATRSGQAAYSVTAQELVADLGRAYRKGGWTGK